MRILLINPPAKNMISSEIPAFVNREIGLFPPLGLMYIASYLMKDGNREVKILDALADKLDYSSIGAEIERYNPDILGITTYTNNLLDVIAVAKLAKEINQKIHVCLGGPHIKAFPLETINLSSVDSVIPDAEELVFSALAKTIEQKKRLCEIRGVIFKDNGRIVETGIEERVSDLDSMPFPARNLLNPKNYHYILSKEINITTMLTSRGCPYQCIFCSTPKGPHRARSPKNIVKEMRECAKLGLDEIHFVDDTFNASSQRVLDICEEIIRAKLKIDWSFRGRVDTVTYEMLVKVKESGCVRINFGVESSSDEGLRALKKGITIEEVKRVFRWTRQIGIPTVAYFMLGCPFEKSKEDILRTIDFAVKLNPDFALFNVLAVYPGTALYEEGMQGGMFKTDLWREFAVSPHKDFIVPVWEEWLSRDELFSLLNTAYRKFYLRPSFMLRTLGSVRNAKGFFRKLKAGLSISRS